MKFPSVKIRWNLWYDEINRFFNGFVQKLLLDVLFYFFCAIPCIIVYTGMNQTDPGREENMRMNYMDDFECDTLWILCVNWIWLDDRENQKIKRKEKLEII